MAALYQAVALERIARQILEGAGVPHAPASAVAAGLLQADLYGHRTHGLQLLGDYVEAIEDGSMARDGEPQLLHSHGAVGPQAGAGCPASGRRRWRSIAPRHWRSNSASTPSRCGNHHTAWRRSSRAARRGALILIFGSISAGW